MIFFLAFIGLAACTFGITVDAVYLILTAFKHTDDNLL